DGHVTGVQTCALPIYQIQGYSEASGLRIANVFHAGDGNLHPLVLFDADDDEQTRVTIEVGGKIMAACAAAGGTLSGEHGIGMEKIGRASGRGRKWRVR